MNEIMSVALDNGLWAALFCFLFFYMLKDSRNREKRYSVALERLSRNLDETATALKVCEDIKENVERNSAVCKTIKRDSEIIKDGINVLRAQKELL